MTTTKALTKIFQKNTTAPYRVWKHRFLHGKLGLEVQESILRENGFIKKKDAIWIKK